MRKRARYVLGLTLLLFGSTGWAEVPLSRCMDRTAAADPARAASAFLPEARYSCLRLGNGRHVLVAEAGDVNRPAVFLVHGLGNNAHRDWRRTIPELAPHFRVVAIDLPGFGSSETLLERYSFAQLDAVLLEVLTRLQLGRVHLVGHSLGAAASLYFAHRHPQLIDRLVLVNIAGVLLEPVFLRQLAEANAAAIGLSSLEGLAGLFGGGTQDGGNLLDWLESQPRLVRLLMEHPSIRNNLLGWELHAEAALGLLEQDFTAAIRDTAAPTTVIWGRDDTVTALRTGRLLAARMQNAQLQIIERAQHMPMHQTPAEFNRVLMRALTEQASPPAVVPGAPAQGSVSCLNQRNVRYTGSYQSISLQNCSDVRIENARATHIRALRSSVVLENVIVDSVETALHAEGSQVTATGANFTGRVGILAIGGRLDLAGVTLRAADRGVDADPAARIYFSVSDYDAPDYRGDAHFVWPPARSGP